MLINVDAGLLLWHTVVDLNCPDRYLIVRDDSVLNITTRLSLVVGSPAEACKCRVLEHFCAQVCGQPVSRSRESRC
ncbi:hypothetical protein JOF29_000165 [Kribbella aluminosa]|uniref:Uncharacterized protein n=1 Tax=Kribbella aluminosa TaxID=416017 RepID=A0ABS4UBR9_9ACTN|nr:hypothetical protein [Kribbella aluminosa]